MEMRKHDAGYAQPIPALDVSLRSMVSNDDARIPDSRLPDLLPFDHVRRACELAIAKGDYHTAWRGAQALMRRCPEALIPSILMGKALLVGDKPGLAMTHFRLVITRNAMDSQAWHGLASSLTACQQFPAAAAATRRAVCNAPLNDHGLPTDAATAVPHALGMIYLRRGMADMAVVNWVIPCGNHRHATICSGVISMHCAKVIVSKKPNAYSRIMTLCLNLSFPCFVCGPY